MLGQQNRPLLSFRQLDDAQLDAVLAGAIGRLVAGVALIDMD
jgi:hypothetical protein